ncbi:HD domain-containing protein, partial [Desulfosarcina cetonica]|uniref:HD domain-containing protein n=1 Tax=Desulfosarcina cetonica TaxID=90730 RepID=UPI0012EEDC64
MSGTSAAIPPDPRSLKPAILAHDGRGGLKTVLDRFTAEARDVPLADEGALLDMDTPTDFDRLTERAAMAEILTDRECDLLMTTVCRLPQAIDDHCRQVARIAGRLGDAVLAAGGRLDVARIRCAARIHDLARLEKDHAAAGARFLRQMGFADL